MLLFYYKKLEINRKLSNIILNELSLIGDAITTGEYSNNLGKYSTVSVVMQIVNGGQNGYADRLKIYNKVAPILGLNSELE